MWKNASRPELQQNQFIVITWGFISAECAPVSLRQQPSLFSKIRKQKSFSLSLSQQHIYICQESRWCEAESWKWGRDNSATLNGNLKTCRSRSHDSDWYQRDRWLYITYVGEWRLSANQTVHFNFHLGCAILWGQRAIWLACKKYYPLSTSYHSRVGEQQPVWNPGSSYLESHWLCNDRCPGKGHGARRHPSTPAQN